MKNGYNSLFLLTIVNSLSFTVVYGVCTFPSILEGNWISSDQGTLNFTSDTIWNYPLPVTLAVRQVNLGCELINGDTYMLKTTQPFKLFGFDFDAYICLELHRVSAYKFWYQVANTVEPSTGLRMKAFLDSKNPNYTEACNREQPFSVSTFNTLVKEGALEDGLVEATCPFELLHTYTNGSLTSADGMTSCVNTTLDICTDRTQMRITYDTSCDASLKITSDGLNICLLDRTNDTSGVTYLHVWNNDTSLATGFKRINCYAFEKRNDSMIATLYPGACKESQTPDVVDNPGIYVQYDSITKTCQDTAGSGSQVLYYVAVILGGIGFIILTVLLICCICKTKCRCCNRLCKKTKIGHSDASLRSKMEEGMEPYLRAIKKTDVSRDMFIPRKPIKLGPIIEPYLQPPPKVELLYDVEPRPTSSRLMFTKSVFFSEISLRHKDIDSPSDVRIEQIDY